MQNKTSQSRVNNSKTDCIKYFPVCFNSIAECSKYGLKRFSLLKGITQGLNVSVSLKGLHSLMIVSFL